MLEFVEKAFEMVNLDYEMYVVTDPILYRPAEVELLIGDATKACSSLGWSATTSFASLVREMVEADCRASGIEVPARQSSVSA